MNREIKFRGKTKSDGLWEFGSLLIENDKYYIYGTDNNWWEVIPETIGQYTGLKDKNGKEIYEGDIVHFTPKVGERVCDKLVFWHDTNKYFAICDIEDYQDKYSIDYHEMLTFYTQILQYSEIIGNIYDNPELGELNG